MELLEAFTDGQVSALEQAAEIVLRLHDEGRVKMSAAEHQDLKDAHERLEGMNK